jgi:hypothetical protein
MRFLRVSFLAALVALAGLLTAGAPAANARTLSGQTIVMVGASQSGNWGGYVQGILEPNKHGGFHQVSAAWKVPTATAHQHGRTEVSATWVGIGGGCLNPTCLATDPTTLIQAGSTQSVDSAGHATYDVWYELIPAPSITITQLAVKAGDNVFVNIKELVNNSNVWQITVSVNGKKVTHTVPYTSSHASVEWIEETPITIGTGGTGLAAMPNLTTTQFTNPKVNGGPAHLVRAEQILLVSNGQRIVTPSAPDNSGNFRVCTYATSCA